MTERYPDPTQIDEKLLVNLLKLPDGNTIDLEWIKKNVCPEAKSFEIPRSSVLRGMQANMFKIEITCLVDDASNTISNDQEIKSTQSIIAKRIVPSELPPKEDDGKLKQFISSVRREIEFYKNMMLPTNKPINRLFPTVYTSMSTPRSWDDTEPENTSFIMLLSDLSDEYYQSPSMNKEQTNALMKALSKLHSHFWQRSDIMTMDRGGFWVLERRMLYGELEKANTTWSGVLERFPELHELNLKNISNIASELVSKAKILDYFVEKRCNTLIHGDAKGWNLFLNKKESDDTQEKIIFIDMQWVGKGHPLQDVAYALTTSLDAELLDEMDYFVDSYICCLEMANKKNMDIDIKEMRLEYDLIWLDYVRVIVTGLWKNLDPERMKRYQNTVGPSMINRSFDHVKFITKRAHHLLFENRDIADKLRKIEMEMS